MNKLRDNILVALLELNGEDTGTSITEIAKRAECSEAEVLDVFNAYSEDFIDSSNADEDSLMLSNKGMIRAKSYTKHK